MTSEITTIGRMDERAVALESISTPDLRRRLVEQINVTAEAISGLAAIWTELERRGEDLSSLRSGLAYYLPAVASGRLLPEAVVRCAGNRPALRALSLLSPAEQRQALDGGVPVGADCVPIHRITQQQIAASIDTVAGRLIPPSEQREPRRRRRSAAAYTARVIVPLTADEHARLQNAAARAGRTAADLARAALKTNGDI